jgi:O-antigen/teichoic acid export membrane protein
LNARFTSPPEPPASPAGDPVPDPVAVLDTGRAGGKAIRGGVIVSGSYVVTTLLTAATVPLMVRALGVEDFGKFVTASAAVMILAGVTEAGLTGIGTREYVSVDARDRRGVLANLVGMRSLLTLAGVAIGCAVMALLGYESVVITGVAISGAGLLLTVVQSTWTIPLAGGMRWGWVSFLGVLRAAVTALLVVLLAVLGAELITWFWVSVAAAGVVLVVTGWKLRREIHWRPAFDYSWWWRLVRDALPYTAATTVGIFYFRIALMMLALVGTERETGYYSAAYKIVEILGGFAGLTVGVAFPVLARAARDDRQRLRYGVTRVFETTLMAGCWLSLALFVSAPLAIDIVAGADFEPAVEVLRWQALTLIPGFALASLGYALLSVREHRALLVGSLIALLVSVVAALVLVPPHGAVGAAAATVLAELSLALSYGVLLARSHPELRPPALALARVFAALVPALGVGLLPLPAAALLVLSSAVYFAVLARVGGIPGELWSAFAARLPLGQGRSP